MLRSKTDEASVSTSSCLLLLLWSSRASEGLILSATKIWAGSDANPLGEWWSLFPPGCTVKEALAAAWCFLLFVVGVWPSHLWTAGLRKVKDSFAVDFRVKIFSFLLFGCKLDHFRGCKCVQSPKRHTRVNAAECSVFVWVTKIISVFLPFYYLSWRIKPPGIINSQRLPV